MFALASQGYRCIAHDRRGHGRSSQPWNGNEMNTYADDLLVLFEHLNLRNVMLVGHSTGGGEVVRFLGRHGSNRVSKAVLISAVPPVMVKKYSNPQGLPIEVRVFDDIKKYAILIMTQVFDGFRAAMLADRAQFFLDVPTGPFFGFNRPNTKSSQGLIQNWYGQGMQAGFKNAYDCVKVSNI